MVENFPFIADSVRGVVYQPKGLGPFPGVIIVPGSDGGIPTKIARNVAIEGYAILALGYFAIDGLTPFMENIPLEIFPNAIDQFRKQVELTSLTVMGYSRGGELALLLGAMFPQIAEGIVAWVPNSYVCGGFPYINRPAWQFGGKPISPFIRGLMSEAPNFTEAEDLALATQQGVIPFHHNTPEDPYDVVDLFYARHRHQEAFSIPVENITSSLLLISGKEDKVWPSSLYAEHIMQRLFQKGSTIERNSLVYPAGHGLMASYSRPVYHPVGKFWCHMGGTEEGNRQASLEAWQATFHFLKKISALH